ncbi:MAG TPA: hypothetical protein VF158_05190 [Longimicrobiales bacterium]
MATRVSDLREVLARRFPDAVPVTYGTAGAVATGVTALDRVLPGGGLPRGRLSVWVPGGGGTAVLQGACAAVVERRERAAWVDGAGVLTCVPGGMGGGAGADMAPLVLRPADGRAALACAEELLRSGGFALVVLSGVEVVGVEAVRLSRAVREGGGAFVALTGGASVAALRLASRIAPEGYRWRRGAFGEPAEVESVRVEVRVWGMGLSARAEFLLPVVQHELRLSLESALADRRGSGR